MNAAVETQAVASGLQQIYKESSVATQAEQIPRAKEPTLEQRDAAEEYATEKRRTAQAKKRALRRKEQANEREAVARREALRQDMVLQKRLMEQYGYNRYISTFAADGQRAFELVSMNIRKLDEGKTVSPVPKETASYKPSGNLGGTVPAQDKDRNFVF